MNHSKSISHPLKCRLSLGRSLGNLVTEATKGFVVPPAAGVAFYNLAENPTTGLTMTVLATVGMMVVDYMKERERHPLATIGYSLCFMVGGTLAVLSTFYDLKIPDF